MANGDEHDRIRDDGVVIRDHRKWHLSKEVSLPLVISVLGIAVAGISAWVTTQRDVSDQAKQILELTTTLKETNVELRAMRTAQAEGNVPSALNAARITSLETHYREDRQRVADMERELRALAVRVTANEQRLSTETIRNRAAARER